jgi:hypothetical protein
MVAGYYSPGPDGNFMVMPWAAKDRGALRIVIHEFTHDLLGRQLTVLPAWISEGVAEFYSTFRVDRESNQIVVGEPPRDRLPALYLIPLMPLGQLTSTVDPMRYQDERTRGMFYAQSWALVHYLFAGNQGARTRQIGTYVRLLSGGDFPANAFKTAFGGTHEELYKELLNYIKGSRFPYLRMRPGTAGGLVADVSRVEAMPDGDAAALRAAIYLRAGATREAEVAYVGAQARPPTSLRGRIALDWVRVRLGVTLDAAARYEALVAMTKEAAAGASFDTATYLHLSLAALCAGRDSESDASLAEAYRQYPSSVIYSRRASLAFTLGRDDVTVRDVAAFFASRDARSNEIAPNLAFMGAVAARRLNRPEEAAGMLDKVASWLPPFSWTTRMLLYMRHAIPQSEILGAADTDDQRTEARTYAGFDDALAGKRETAIRHLQWVQEKGNRYSLEYQMAVAELKRLQAGGPK